MLIVKGTLHMVGRHFERKLQRKMIRDVTLNSTMGVALAFMIRGELEWKKGYFQSIPLNIMHTTAIKSTRVRL